MQLSCCLDKHLSQDILECDLSTGIYTMEILVLYCVAAGAIFALNWNDNVCPGRVPRKRMAALSASFFHSNTKKFPPDHRVASAQKEHLKSYLHSQLLYCLQFSTHTTFFSWFFSGRTGGLLQQSQEEEDAHFKNNSGFIKGTPCPVIKSVIANSSLSCF